MDYDLDRKIASIVPNSPEYQRVHRWVRKELGKAKECSIDSSHESNRYDWSNISRDYLWDLSDWRQLCRRCHKLYDFITKDGLARISKANKLNSLGNSNAAKPIQCIDTKTSYRSTRDAAKSLNILATSINNCLKGKTKTAGGYHWQRRIVS